MYGKRKTYEWVRFPDNVFEQAISKFEEIVGREKDDMRHRYTLSYERNKEETLVRNPGIEYRKQAYSHSHFNLNGYSGKDNGYIGFSRSNNNIDIRVEDFDELSKAEAIQQIFDNSYEASKLPPREIIRNIEVFIGHGRSRLWRDLKDHLQDHHGIAVTAYETGQRAGYTIQEVLSDLSGSASLALLVHTGEDANPDGLTRARENVIHETGLFQGRIGFKKSIVILEDGTSEFSNIHGLQQLRFSKGNIKEIFGDVLAVIKREFR